MIHAHAEVVKNTKSAVDVDVVINKISVTHNEE